MPGSQTIATVNSARENLPAPRDLNQSFQRPATQQTAFSEINDAQQRIAELERAVHSLLNEKTIKDNNIQALQATVERLQADMFDDIDGAGMQADPDDHLHSNWRPATSPLFSSPTPVKPSNVVYPDAPRLQQQFPPVIDQASELAMLKKQIQELNHRLLTTPMSNQDRRHSLHHMMLQWCSFLSSNQLSRNSDTSETLTMSR
jgi:hypothetical protein